MNRPEVAVIDYGAGNLLSVQRALEHCGAAVTLTSAPEAVLASERVVLPGVGAFPNGMRALRERNLIDAIREVFARGQALLGICLGMQLLMDAGEEFEVTPGLGIVPGRVIPIPRTTTHGVPQRIPHIGWSGLQPAGSHGRWHGTPLEALEPGAATYFVHSYMAVPDHADDLLGRGRVIGCQFHPEKSGAVGLMLLRGFLRW
jgi:imidazole glycerol-phosphate synthase subunit HisH